jgi:GT2 family glycosyltransferase
MKLSVVIVNYNVRAYLEQCLRTVYEALDGIDGEVFVVDNLSTDGSVELVRDKFPQVQLIANRENVGFSRANNQAIRVAKGDYVLLLNPDTVVAEDVFRKVLEFMDAHPRCGGLGVKMIDGTGRFLPESKRGLPTPQVAFFKIIGLTRLFPQSRVFGRYHLGHLPEDEAAPIEILSGACMFLRKKTLDEVGLLDESFFMYGEDIDLSYRITLGGYENWYFPDVRIIHYKGESTKKSSVNYVFVFYNAMAIFAKKHFTQKSAGIFPALINGSIYLSAAGAIAVRFLNRAMLPILDLLAMVLVLALVVPVVPVRWSLFPELGVDMVIALFTLAWIGSWGGYDRPVRPLRPLLAMGTLFVLTTIVRYAINGDLQEVAGMALLFGWSTFLMLAVRTGLHLLRIKGYGMRRRERERIIAVGSELESTRALALLWQTHYGLGWTTHLSPEEVRKDAGLVKRTIEQHGAGEVVFCANDMPWGEIIGHIEMLRSGSAEIKIAQPDREFIIGPSSIESLQDLYILEGRTIGSPAGRRAKRLLDLAVSVFLTIAAPVLVWFVPGPSRYFRNIGDVLSGRKSWVGYSSAIPRSTKLPALPPGVLDTATGLQGDQLDPLTLARLNSTYAKDYSPIEDLRILVQGIRRVGIS